MVVEREVDRLIEQYQRALGEFVKGDSRPVQELFSHGEDVSLANPLGPLARGWEQVAQTIERAARNFRGGEMVAFEYVAKYVTPELAYAVWLEQSRVNVGGREDLAPSTLRVTMVFRPEDGTWKIVHRHADPITTARPAESILRE